MKTVAAIHDLSCYAKSSLTVVIPTLSAMGIEVAVLPTALLSTQTGGFSDFYYQDLSGAMQAIINHWQKLSLQFNAIYSGFLGSEQQIDIVTAFIHNQRCQCSPLVVVDPVLGDDGSAYEPITSELVRRMIELVRNADVITPNVTEAALLLGEPYKMNLKPEEAVIWAKRLSALGPRWVAITSVLQDNGGVVVCYDRDIDEQAMSYQPYAPISYPGSGDLFASILCALLLKGDRFLSAAAESARLVSKAVFASWNSGMECRHGVSVELIIQELMKASQV